MVLISCALLVVLGRVLLLTDASPGGWTWVFVSVAIVVVVATAVLVRLRRER